VVGPGTPVIQLSTYLRQRSAAATQSFRRADHHSSLNNSHLLDVTSCHTAGLCVVMRWPPWSTVSSNDDKQHPERTSNSSSASTYPTPTTNKSDSGLSWTGFTESRTLISTVLLTSGILLAVRFHRTYLRRIPDAPSISTSCLRRRTIFGKVTSVGDGDNFRIFHTPGGRLVGWGWLPWKKIPTTKKELKDNTVRLSIPVHLVVANAASTRSTMQTDTSSLPARFTSV
jgi:hypothetical protein